MKELYKVTFDTEDSIVAATLSKPDEIVLLLSSGSVQRFDRTAWEVKHLFSVNNGINYSDGGFDPMAPSSIYTLDDIVVVVNDFKTHGFIHYPGKYRALHFSREDYYARLSCYPIALFKDGAQVPHIIYGEAWNHLQVMNLDTRQVLTAAKSLIEENAEERHIEFYKQYEEHNKLPWPSRYDYFFGRLKLSGDNKYFLSTGWAWGSSDSYRVYDTTHFISNPRIADIKVGYWEHENRATCWIDNNTIVVAYSPFMEGDDGATADTAQEIHFYTLIEGKVEAGKIVTVAGLNMISATMAYNGQLGALVLFSEKVGVALLSLEGAILYHNSELRVNHYFADMDCFLTFSGKTIEVSRITWPGTADQA